LISLIECKVGGSTTDIICACLFFSVLITALCGPVSMATDPNVATLHSINDIKLTLYSNIKIPKEIAHRSRGCVICPNGKMLFTDKSAMNLVILNINPLDSSQNSNLPLWYVIP
jgi:hypothetical protein